MDQKRCIRCENDVENGGQLALQKSKHTKMTKH